MHWSLFLHCLYSRQPLKHNLGYVFVAQQQSHQAFCKCNIGYYVCFSPGWFNWTSGILLNGCHSNTLLNRIISKRTCFYEIRVKRITFNLLNSHLNLSGLMMKRYVWQYTRNELCSKKSPLRPQKCNCRPRLKYPNIKSVPNCLVMLPTVFWYSLLPSSSVNVLPMVFAPANGVPLVWHMLFQLPRNDKASESVVIAVSQWWGINVSLCKAINK